MAISRRSLELLMLLGFVATLAYASPLSPRDDDDDDSSSSSSSSSSSAPDGIDLSSLAATIALQSRVQKAHAVLGCLAFALVFPTGGMLVRTRASSVWAHAAWQTLGWAMALATLGSGVWMAKGTSYIETTHALVGIVAVAAVSAQPATGLAHHVLFRRAGRRTVVSYVHVGWGWAAVSLGIVNAGLGLQLAGAARTYKVVYGVLAALVWLLWVAVSARAHVLARKGKGSSARGKDSPREPASLDGEAGVPAAAEMQQVRDKAAGRE